MSSFKVTVEYNHRPQNHRKAYTSLALTLTLGNEIQLKTMCSLKWGLWKKKKKKGSHIVGILIINVKKNKVSLSHFHNNNFTFVFPPKRFPCSYFINHEENNHNTKTCVCLCDPVMVKCWQKAHCLLHFPHGEWMLNRAVYHWKYNSRT